jgi:hypothetical protein
VEFALPTAVHPNKGKMHMTNIITQNQSDSPFDSIRHFDKQGNEFWNARELMPLLGYPRWNDFKASIDRAMVSLSVQHGQNEVSKHFSGAILKTNGRPKENYKLSRLASYLIAMNGDPRKPEIASAQSYFVIKTREAEVIIPAQNEALEFAKLEVEKLKLQNENLKLENENMRMKVSYLERRKALSDMYGDQKLLLLDGRPEAVVPVQETVTETIVTQGNRTTDYKGYSTAQIAKELGFKTGRELEDWLKAIGQDHLVNEGKRVIPSLYVPVENKQEIMRVWIETRQGRQLIIGE